MAWEKASQISLRNYSKEEEEKENPPKRANPPHRASSQGLGGGGPWGIAPLLLFGAQPPLARTLPRGASLAARTARPPGVSENRGEGGGSEALQGDRRETGTADRVAWTWVGLWREGAVGARGTAPRRLGGAGLLRGGAEAARGRVAAILEKGKEGQSRPQECAAQWPEGCVLLGITRQTPRETPEIWFIPLQCERFHRSRPEEFKRTSVKRPQSYLWANLEGTSLPADGPDPMAVTGTILSLVSPDTDNWPECPDRSPGPGCRNLVKGPQPELRIGD
ncbi:uncharacterized protein [Odocoileus virginianus]|uniref:Uncharacterized protein n=1 Tax=Odocoileus virginianus TaxID=9874 RepID=A0ABM4H0N4_ODOVR